MEISPTTIHTLHGKVFCIGLGRTGTTTFAACMRRLGSRHLGWDGGNAGMRRDLGLLAAIDERAFLGYLDRFDSADDYPVPLMYRRLAEFYPDARFVLTMRLSPERWAASVISEFNRKNFNEGENTWYEGDLSAPDRESRLLKRYEAHLSAVREFFASSPRFLEVCWERGDGWAELCGFLGLSTPADPFPHFNRARSMLPPDFVRHLVQEKRHGKLALYLKDQKDESLVQETRRILISRLDHQLRHGKDSSNWNGQAIVRGARRKVGFLTDRLCTALRQAFFALQKTLQFTKRAPAEPARPFALAICAIFRDEARYLNEWITFHRGVGVERFYLYNDRSTDDYRAVLAPWIERGIVLLRDWNEKSLVDAFNDCLQQHRDEVAWIAFLDIDEFLYSPSGCPVPEILERYDDAAAVFVHWALFGSSGHAAPPSTSVISSYRRCQGLASAIRDEFDHGTPGTSDHVTAWSRDGKSIVRSAWVKTINNHQPSKVWFGRIVDEIGQEMPKTAVERRTCKLPFSYSALRINHYWSKSLRELARRSERGSVFDRSRPPKNLKRIMERERDLNEIIDESIQPLWDRIKHSESFCDQKTSV